MECGLAEAATAGFEPQSSWDGFRTWLQSGEYGDVGMKEWWQNGTFFRMEGADVVTMKDLPRALRRERIRAEIFLLAFI